MVQLRLGNIDALRHAIPLRWVHRWRTLRKAVGRSMGTDHSGGPDICRHTFAACHAAHFRNFAVLRLEMGRRESSLLRTRYEYAGNDSEAFAQRYFRV